MSRRLRACAVAFLAGILIEGSAATGAAPQSPLRFGGSIAQSILDAYDRGTTVQTMFFGSATFVDDFQSTATKWIAAAPESARARRRQVAAFAALDTVRVYGVDFREARFLVEWACDLLRRDPQTEFERVWHLASVAYAEPQHDEAFLFVPAGEECNARRKTLTACDHGRHGLARFPGEGRLKLAEALVRREVNVVSNRPGAPIDFLLDVGLKKGDAATYRRERLSQTYAILDSLAGDPVVGGEARLRRGILHYELDELIESHADLDASSKSADPFVRYLGFLVSGMAYEAQGLLPRAVDRYQAALGAIPEGATAATRLALAWFLSDRRQEAADVLTKSLTTESSANDPWRVYSHGDYRLYSSYATRMREILK